MILRDATAADRVAARDLLVAAGLPVDDLDDTGVNLRVAVDAAGIPEGVVGLQRFGDIALLRSLAVRPDRRAGGLGGALVAAAEHDARAAGVRRLVLLTTTAAGFFARHGYTPCARDDVPADVRGSTQFASSCPASATCLHKDLPARRVLFVCVENANRSQMAEAFARMLGGAGVLAESAGSRPSGTINPKAVRAMAELGYDLSTHRSRSLDEITGEYDAVITMGCGDRCPWVPARRREDWALTDPRDLDGDAYRAIRDDIGERVRALLASL